MPRKSLITISKSFIRPHLDQGDIIYDQTYNTSFHRKLESIQYNAALAITCALRGTSKEKLYQELGFEPLKPRRWYRKLCYFYKIFKKQSPNYLFRLIPKKTTCKGMKREIQEAFFSVELIMNISKKNFFPRLQKNGICLIPIFEAPKANFFFFFAALNLKE